MSDQNKEQGLSSGRSWQDFIDMADSVGVPADFLDDRELQPTQDRDPFLEFEKPDFR